SRGAPHPCPPSTRARAASSRARPGRFRMRGSDQRAHKILGRPRWSRVRAAIVSKPDPRTSVAPMARRILLDCDPGLDDALALLLVHGDPALELVAVTTVAGNVPLERTTRNALDLREYLGFTSVPVAAGADAPLSRPLQDSSHVHGTS